MHKDTLKWINAINHLAPGAGWSINNDDPSYETLVWNDNRLDHQKPTEEAILEKIAFIESLEYQEKRSKEYPPLSEFADAMYWASQGDNTKLDTYYAACEAVKLKYPKA
jgi:hypothetical protein